MIKSAVYRVQLETINAGLQNILFDNTRCKNCQEELLEKKVLEILPLIKSAVYRVQLETINAGLQNILFDNTR